MPAREEKHVVETPGCQKYLVKQNLQCEWYKEDNLRKLEVRAQFDGKITMDVPKKIQIVMLNQTGRAGSAMAGAAFVIESSLLDVYWTYSAVLNVRLGDENQRLSDHRG